MRIDAIFKIGILLVGLSISVMLLLNYLKPPKEYYMQVGAGRIMNSVTGRMYYAEGRGKYYYYNSKDEKCHVRNLPSLVY